MFTFVCAPSVVQILQTDDAEIMKSGHLHANRFVHSVDSNCQTDLFSHCGYVKYLRYLLHNHNILVNAAY